MADTEQEEGFIEVKLGDKTFRGNYLKDLAVSEAGMNEELKNQPSKYVFWAKMAAMQRVVSEMRKMERDRYEAQLYTFIRNEMETQGRKATERGVESKILLDGTYRQHQEKVLRANLQLDLLKAIEHAFQERLSTLMSLGANLREEWNTTLAIKEKQFAEKRERMVRTAPPPNPKSL